MMQKIVDYYHIFKLKLNARSCIEISGNICNEIQHNFTFFCAFKKTRFKTIFAKRARLAKQQVWCCNLHLKLTSGVSSFRVWVLVKTGKPVQL